ncbi:hypothetical protein [Microbacterium sp. 77mftsu3.1]|uniref:hypothetical protein n=1 Tax=Microbacterium sp. 77mftsu3.1 TaxID=1761802 RepID=UPI00036FA696|nr:hypothetical protein [Microbacterium sp. 77mftsu3.1]SDG61669.1 hypothetical protein SAMN04488590_1298 [Microbacterium sp. 77mftsu3.1]
MGIPVTDELRALRARVYGPAADIHLDPAAMRRLEELEEAGRRSPAVELPVAPPADVAVADEDAAASPSAADVAPPAPELPFWRRPRVRTATWAVGLVVAALLGAGLTYSVVAITPVSTSSGAEQIATLTPSTTLRIPPGYFGWEDGGSAFEYAGLTILQTSNSFIAAGVGDAPCIQVLETRLVPDPQEFDEAGGWSYDGNLWGGCSVGAFPASAAVPLSGEGAPKVDLPDGRALQFVLEGDRVGVFLDRG